MFCLRSWLPLLIFLTNASPIYVILFLTANYVLQRPCVYCSILLFVLIFSLFDFNADWFEPRWPKDAASPTETISSLLSGNATMSDALFETAAMAVTAINGTGGSLASSAMDGIKKAFTAQVPGNASIGGGDWIRAFAEKRQFRIPCLDVMVAL
ncbi:hypothetical protein AMS68_007576 [Peltaster fructicola]|uniref:Uncharacterized protein n=1 Tax=Peltaster fructicola TaxID=286661 RepID=A0A6H0Y5F4_9PEZI|nr:hypothetical protein AMS68_007576 [Peltaster fructicola]